MSLVELSHGPFAAQIAALWGGRLLSFTADGHHYLRPAPHEGAAPTNCACFPLVPFSNRIAGGRFDFQGRSITLPRNFDRGRHAIHGYGWINDWRVTARAGNSASLTLHDPGTGHWPWRYSAQQTFTLSDQGLTVTLSVQNLSDAVMPTGLGLHPYFPAAPDTRVQLTAGGIVEKDDADLPCRINTNHAALPGLRDGSPLQGGLDTSIDGWDGTAQITWPDSGRQLRMTASGITRAVYFTPPGADFFCLEPVTHLTNAHNNTLGGDGGLVDLAPQATMTLEAQFSPEA